MEMVFGDDVVLATVEHVPNRTDTRQMETFALISSVPGPCDDGVRESLAVSSAGNLALCIIAAIDGSIIFSAR